MKKASAPQINIEYTEVFNHKSLIFFLLLVITSCAPWHPKQVLISANSGGMSLSGEIRDCIRKSLAQGLSIKAAIKECGISDYFEVPQSSGISINDALGLIENGEHFGNAACGGIAGNPTVAEDQDPSDHQAGAPNLDPTPDNPGGGFKKPDSEQEAKKGFENALDKFATWIKATGELEAACRGGKTSSCNALAYERTACYFIQSEVHYYGAWVKKFTGSDPSKVNDVRKPVQGAESVCQEVGEFVSKCNQVGWKTNECKMFLNKLNHCADPTIALTEGSNDCRFPAVDEATVKKVWLYMCLRNAKPVGPESTPCQKLSVEGDLYLFRYRNSPSDKGCNNPVALTTGEDCYHTFEISVFGQKDLREAIKEFQEKFGGPVFMLPSGPAPWPPAK